MEKSKHLRLFLGVPIPNSFHIAFDDFLRVNQIQKGISRIPNSNRHITVYFFGGVQKEMLSNLESLLEIGLKDIQSFSLEFERYSFGPSKKNPRMLWARFQKQETFRMLVGRIHELFLQINPSQQMRKSPLPHVTLARLKGGEIPTNINWMPHTEQKILTIDQIILWESVLYPSGAEYKVIRQFWLS